MRKNPFNRSRFGHYGTCTVQVPDGLIVWAAKPIWWATERVAFEDGTGAVEVAITKRPAMQAKAKRHLRAMTRAAFISYI